MIGCMVETSLGISSAMNLYSLADYADLDSFILLKEEPFGMIDEDLSDHLLLVSDMSLKK